VNHRYLNKLRTLFGSLPKQYRIKILWSSLIAIFQVILDFIGVIFLFYTISVVLKIDLDSEFIPIFLVSPLIELGDKFEVAQLLKVVLGALMIFFILKNVITFFLSRIQLSLNYQVGGFLAQRCFSAKLNDNFIDQKKKNSLEELNDLNVITIHFCEQIIYPIQLLIGEILFIAITLISLSVVNWSLLLFLLATLAPVLLILFTRNRKRLNMLGKDLHAILPRLQSRLQLGTLAYPEVKIHKSEKWLTNEFNKDKELIYSKKKRMRLLRGVVPQRILESMVVVGLFLLGFFVLESSNPSALVGLIAFYAALAFRLLPSVNRIVNSVNSISSYQYILDTIPDTDTVTSTDKEMDISFDREIQLKGVSYWYDNFDVFKNQDIRIPKGSMVGLKGISGAGKSTMLNILSGLLMPSEGQILIDERALSEKDINSWQKHVGLIRQDIFLFPGTIRENILFGANHDENRLLEIIEMAALTNWIGELKSGLDTPVGELGSMISGGQKQRIGLARMLYKQADVLLFDEVTKELDSATKASILLTIDGLKQQKTMIIVSHDSDVLCKCDLVYQFENGKITKEDI